MPFQPLIICRRDQKRIHSEVTLTIHTSNPVDTPLLCASYLFYRLSTWTLQHIVCKWFRSNEAKPLSLPVLPNTSLHWCDFVKCKRSLRPAELVRSLNCSLLAREGEKTFWVTVILCNQIWSRLYSVNITEHFSNKHQRRHISDRESSTPM
jgi:hypothetical protein